MNWLRLGGRDAKKPSCSETAVKWPTLNWEFPCKLKYHAPIDDLVLWGCWNRVHRERSWHRNSITSELRLLHQLFFIFSFGRHSRGHGWVEAQATSRFSGRGRFLTFDKSMRTSSIPFRHKVALCLRLSFRRFSKCFNSISNCCSTFPFCARFQFAIWKSF